MNNKNKLIPLSKGGYGGLCIFRAIPHFHEDKFTAPSPPFLRGILYAIYRITCINKMKILIQLNYAKQDLMQNHKNL